MGSGDRIRTPRCPPFLTSMRMHLSGLGDGGTWSCFMKYMLRSVLRLSHIRPSSNLAMGHWDSVTAYLHADSYQSTEGTECDPSSAKHVLASYRRVVNALLFLKSNFELLSRPVTGDVDVFQPWSVKAYFISFRSVCVVMWKMHRLKSLSIGVIPSSPGFLQQNKNVAISGLPIKYTKIRSSLLHLQPNNQHVIRLISPSVSCSHLDGKTLISGDSTLLLFRG